MKAYAIIAGLMWNTYRVINLYTGLRYSRCLEIYRREKVIDTATIHINIKLYRYIQGVS